jgi:hypothetical protein
LNSFKKYFGTGAGAVKRGWGKFLFCVFKKDK